MSRRLYFLFPDVETSEKAVQELLLSRIEEKRMHFLGKRGTEMKSLPEATPSQKTGLLRGIYIGLFSGVITGLLAGLYIYFNPDAVGMQAPPYVIFICAFVGAIIGAWISGPLIGGSTPNTKLVAFQDSLQQGKILLILDTPAKRTEEIKNIIIGLDLGAEEKL
ncbi:MAG: DUF1269 domain-containing protein [Gammaproteobacteria bacterium]|jgi:hypothetical protein